MTKPRPGVRAVRPPRQPFTRGYMGALSKGVDLLEVLAHETDLLLAWEDSSQRPVIAPVAAAEAGKVPAHSKKVAPRAANAGAVAQEVRAPMQSQDYSTVVGGARSPKGKAA